MSYLELAKKAREEYRRKHQGAELRQPLKAEDGVPPDVTEGPIRAVSICSSVLEAHIWLAFDDDFKPDDDDVVFYVDELALLKNKPVSTLRKIYETKKAFALGTRVRQ